MTVVNANMQPAVRKEAIIAKYHKFLMQLYIQCSAGYVSPGISKMISSFGVSTNVTAALHSLGMIRRAGTAPTTLYFWPGCAPTDDDALKVIEKMKQKSAVGQVSPLPKKSLVRILPKSERALTVELPLRDKNATRDKYHEALMALYEQLQSTPSMNIQAFLGSKNVSSAVTTVLKQIGIISKTAKEWKWVSDPPSLEQTTYILDMSNKYTYDRDGFNAKLTEKSGAKPVANAEKMPEKKIEKPVDVRKELALKLVSLGEYAAANKVLSELCPS